MYTNISKLQWVLDRRVLGKEGLSSTLSSRRPLLVTVRPDLELLSLALPMDVLLDCALNAHHPSRLDVFLNDNGGSYYDLQSLRSMLHLDVHRMKLPKEPQRQVQPFRCRVHGILKCIGLLRTLCLPCLLSSIARF
jgi:hypothetical protein